MLDLEATASCLGIQYKESQQIHLLTFKMANVKERSDCDIIKGTATVLHDTFSVRVHEVDSHKEQKIRTNVVFLFFP